MWNVYPYKNLTDLNLDFILKAIGEMENQVKNFVALNAIKYADPIQWDITRSYEKNTVVIDGHSGVAYISVAPVPYGVALTRPEYWTVVFDLSMFITKGAANFANSYESQPTTTATMDTAKGNWVVWDSTLFEALTDIHAGDAYVVDGNIRRMTVESFYNILIGYIQNETAARQAADGDLSNLNTADKSNLVDAINEVNGRVGGEILDRQAADGDLSNLNTANKSNLVGAINEVNGRVGGEILDRQAADNNIMRTLNQFANRRVVILTDSYGNVPAGNTFYNTFLNLTGMIDNDNAFLFAYGGCGFVGNTNSWQNVFVASGDIDTVTYRDTITDVYVLGGCNDVNQAELDILEASQTLFNSLRLKFQNANIYVGMFGCTLNPITLDKWQVIKNCYDNMNLYGYQVISGASTWLQYESLMSDYNHPNANGAKYLGKALFNHFKNKGDTQLRYNRPVPCSLSASGIAENPTSYIMTINTCINNNVIQAFTSGTSRITKNNGMTLATNGSDNEIGTLSYTFMNGGTENACISTVPIQLEDTSNNLYSTVGVIKIYKRKLYLSVYPVNGNASINVINIRMLPFKIIADSMSL